MVLLLQWSTYKFLFVWSLDLQLQFIVVWFEFSATYSCSSDFFTDPESMIFFREFSLFSTNLTRWIFFGEKAILEESYEPSLGKLHWAANFYTHIAPSYRDDIVYGRPLIKLQRFLNVDYDIWNLVKELKIGIKVHIFWEGHNNMPKSQNFFWRYKVISNKIWRLRQILVAFSKYMNFT